MKKNPIGKYLLQNWYYYVFAFGSMALSVFLDMLAPLVTLHIVDDVLVSHKMELLWKYLAAFLLIGAAKALFQYIKEFLFDVSSVRVASQMRDNLFRHVQRLSVEYFDKNNTGELLARVRDDVDRIWDILGFAGMLILEGLICIMMAMVSMVKLDLPLTLVSVAILPFVAGIAIRLEKELDRVYDAISEECVTIPFDAAVSADKTLVTGSLLAFGHCAATQNAHQLTIYAVLADESKWYYTYDVTDQIHSAPDQRNVHIVLDGLPLPKPIVNGGGFQPSVDEWQLSLIHI